MTCSRPQRNVHRRGIEPGTPWSEIRRPIHCATPPLQAANIKNKNSITADTFSEYFKSINDPNDRFYQADEDVLFLNEQYLKGEIQVMFEELNVPITVEEIRKDLKHLKNGASAGPALNLNEFLKHGKNGLLHYSLNVL